MSLRLGSVAATVLLVACSGDGSPEPAASPALSPGASPTASIQTVDLASTTPLTTIFARDTGDLRSDQPGLAAGDFNNDGINDIVVGARFADSDGRQDAGAAYVIFGSRNPPASVNVAEGQQDVSVAGARPGDNLGFAATAADLNGDGVDDMVLGAPFAGPLDRASSEPGRVYVIFGRSDLPTSIDLAQDEADVTLTGTGDASFFGDSVATGDVNGDGTTDLVVGATFDTGPGLSGGTVRGGAVYVFFGRQRWPATLAASDAEVAVYGADELDELGDFVASGDINGDGFDDIIAAAEAADGPDNGRPTAAEVHVVFGGDDIRGSFEIARGQQDLSVYGANAQDTLGFSLAAGDVDGDGIDDLIMGARLGSDPDNAIPRAGLVYVLYGRKDLPSSVDLAQLPDFVAAIYGQNEADFLGSSEAVGDLDGDGDNELIMATGFAGARGRLHAGTVYVVKAAEASGFVSVGGGLLRTAIYGASAGDRLGSNVTTTDFNGDGRPELIVVADGAAGPGGSRPEAGRVYIITIPP